MALSVSQAVRADDASGLNVKTGTDGASRHIQFVALADDDGNHLGFSGTPLAVSVEAGAAATYFNTGGAAVASEVVSASAVTVKEFSCLLDATVTASRWCMLFNATSLPANGTAPDQRLLVTAGGVRGQVFETARPFSTGLVMAISTTPGTLTVAASGEGWFYVEHT